MSLAWGLSYLATGCQRREGVRMAGFLFSLETVEGEPAEPPILTAAVPNWGIGDRIYLGHRTLQVVGRRDGEADAPRCWSLTK